MLPGSKTDFPNAGGAGGTLCTPRARGQACVEGAASRRRVILVSRRLRSWRAFYKQDATLPPPRLLGAIRGIGASWGAEGAGPGPGMRARCLLLPPPAMLSPPPQYLLGGGDDGASQPQSLTESCFPRREGASPALALTQEPGRGGAQARLVPSSRPALLPWALQV